MYILRLKVFNFFFKTSFEQNGVVLLLVDNTQIIIVE